MVADIPEGRYTYNVSASGHLPASGVFTVEPGIVTAAPVAMQVDLVNIEWSVTPVVIEDRYEITITQTFETKVPAPVLIVEPPKVDLPAMEPGEVFQGEFKVTNYGLVGVYDVALEFPSSFGEYDVEALAGAIPDKIGAMESVTVPYRITRRVQTASVSGATSLYDEVSGYGGVPCQGSTNITVKSKSVLCPNSPQESIAQRTVRFHITFLNYGTDCGSARITTDGGGGTYSGGSYYDRQGVGDYKAYGVRPKSLEVGNQCCGKSDGTALPDEKPNDCRKKVCISEKERKIADDSETPLGECMVCTDGTPVPKADEFACIAVGMEINGKPYDGEKDYAYVLAGVENAYKAVVQPSGEYGYEWKLTYGGATTYYHEETMAHTFNVPGEYTVELTVKETGCEEEDCGSVTQVFNIRAVDVEITTPANIDMNISALHEMPDVTFEAIVHPEDVNINDVRFDWRLHMDFKGDTGAQEFKHDVTGSVTGSGQWTPDWGGLLAGGIANVSVTATLEELSAANVKEGYEIRGSNPTQAQIFGIADDIEEKAVCWAESSHRQFDGIRYTGVGWPLASYGHDGGYGLMQITWPNPASETEIWNWQVNLQNGVDMLNGAYTTGRGYLIYHYNLNRDDNNALNDWDWDPNLSEYSDRVWDEAFARYGPLENDTGKYFLYNWDGQIVEVEARSPGYAREVRDIVNNQPWQ